MPQCSIWNKLGVLEEERVGDASIEGKLKKLPAKAQDR